MFIAFAVFATALVCGFLFSWQVVARRSRPIKHDFVEGARFKLVTPTGAYRCYVERVTSKGIQVSAPLHRDSYVPLRVGDLVLVQTATPDGLYTFRTAVTHRMIETHSLLLGHPSTIRKTERRSYPRQTPIGDGRCKLNGVTSQLCDFSEFGAKIVSECLVEPGDSVIVELPDGMGEVYGWALDSMPVSGKREARIRFQDPLNHLSSLRAR